MNSYWLEFHLPRMSGWFRWDDDGQIRTIEINRPDPRVITIEHHETRHPLAVDIATKYAADMLETMNRVVRSKQLAVRSRTNGAH